MKFEKEIDDVIIKLVKEGKHDKAIKEIEELLLFCISVLRYFSTGAAFAAFPDTVKKQDEKGIKEKAVKSLDKAGMVLMDAIDEYMEKHNAN